MLSQKEISCVSNIKTRQKTLNRAEETGRIQLAGFSEDRIGVPLRTEGAKDRIMFRAKILKESRASNLTCSLTFREVLLILINQEDIRAILRSLEQSLQRMSSECTLKPK